MRLLIFLNIVFIGTISCLALSIPKGKFYYDNSKTLYSHVKFVYGNDTNAETFVISMTDEGDNIWSINFEYPIDNIYRYTFANTTLDDGKISDTFTNVKDNISNTLQEKRTATTDKTIPTGWIFIPETGDNWAQGSWQPMTETTYSGTLPVLHINTENNAEITSTETYINATFWLDNLSDERFSPIGNDTLQLAMKIRGRGNYTWKDFEKKPYRIKLAEKQPILGMSASRHFALLAHADDDLAFLRNTVGFELSRRLGLKFTPAQQPVELMLNGEYMGLYFLTENIRVAKNRVNITEQADYTSNPDSITGGWLIEIDNYDEEQQIHITEGNGQLIRFSYKSPELLSDEQLNFLTTQMNAIDDAIYNTDKSSILWENLIDCDSLARFYIVQEIMDNAESFHGSCYMHKNYGLSKWIFGPVWDFGNSYRRSWQEFIYQNPPFGQNWIAEIARYPRFNNKVAEIWKEFRANEYHSIHNFIDNFINEIEEASVYDYRRWPAYGSSDIQSDKNSFITMLDNRIDWLITQWGDTGIDNRPATEAHIEYYNLQGVKIDNPSYGIYIKIANGHATKVIVR